MPQSQTKSSTSFTVTSRVIEFLKVVNGSQVDLDLINQINNGRLDLLIGLVVNQNCMPSRNSHAQVTDSLEQFEVLTLGGELFTLTNNRDLLISTTVIDSLDNTYLINRPKEIGIINLNDFRDKIQEASRYGQPISCFYDRIKGEILFVNIMMNKAVLEITKYKAENSFLSSGGGSNSGTPIGWSSRQLSSGGGSNSGTPIGW